MKIHHILNGISIMITNEERDFIKRFQSVIPLSSLNEHDVWTAQNLVRKGVYKLTNDSKNIVIVKGYEDKHRNI
jgi:hypothetical protein